MNRVLGAPIAVACTAALTACASAPQGGMPARAPSSAPASVSAAGSAGAGSMAPMAAGTGVAVSVAGAPMYANRNIIENAQHSPVHRTLVAAVIQAQLAQTLSGPGPFTVFAPTDEAFNAVPASARASLMQEANRAQLRNVLTYHVVPGRLTAADLAAQVRAGNGTAILTTAQGGRLTVRMSGNALVVTDATGAAARVTIGDVLQSNGVIHVVDRVLMAG